MPSKVIRLVSPRLQTPRSLYRCTHSSRPGRPLPGQDPHLLERHTFARHTWSASACPVDRPDGRIGYRRITCCSGPVPRNRKTGPEVSLDSGQLTARLYQPTRQQTGRSVLIPMNSHSGEGVYAGSHCLPASPMKKQPPALQSGAAYGAGRVTCLLAKHGPVWGFSPASAEPSTRIRHSEVGGGDQVRASAPSRCVEITCGAAFTSSAAGRRMVSKLIRPCRATSDICVSLTPAVLARHRTRCQRGAPRMVPEPSRAPIPCQQVVLRCLNGARPACRPGR